MLRIEIAPRTLWYVLLAIAGVWIAFKLTTVLIVIVVALVLVGTFDPLVSWLERRGLKRGRALALVFFGFIVAFAALMLFTIPPLMSQVLDMLQHAPKHRDKLVAWLQQYDWSRSLAKSIKSVPLNDLTTEGGNRLLDYSEDILTTIGYAVTTMFLAVYLLADPVRSRALLFAVIPRNQHVKLASILFELKVIVGGYMRGQLITSAAITVFVFILLTIFRVENALALAIFAGLTDVIPFVGGLIASAPVVAAVAGSGPTAMVIVAIIMFVYQEFESRILVPRVYGRVLRLTPAVVLVALLVGGKLAGIVGALLALPIAAGLQMLVRELRVDLPGEAPPDEQVRERDEKALEVYEQLTEGATAADAAVIAAELAHKIKETEKTGTTITSELPAIVAELSSTLPADPPVEGAVMEPETEPDKKDRGDD